MTRSLLFTLLLALPPAAATIHEAWYPSTILGREIRYLVCTPDGYETEGGSYPVLYLLHCAGCRDSTWLADGPNYADADAWVDTFSTIAVLPSDGSHLTYEYSWWLDSPRIDSMQLSRFLTEELKPQIDADWRTLPGRATTGVAGHSMGGFGALYNLLHHPHLFCGAGASKPGVDLRYPKNPDWPGYFYLDSLLGTDPAVWEEHNLIAQAGTFGGDSLALCLINGTNDPWFFNEVRAFHDTLTTQGISPCYREVDESHSRVSSLSMGTVFAFFDSLFAEALPVHPGREGMHLPQKGEHNPMRSVRYDLSGRRAIGEVCGVQLLGMEGRVRVVLPPSARQGF